MTIRQLPKPCFVLDPSPWDDDHGTPHYGTWAEADEALRERREELGPDPLDLAGIETTRVGQAGSPCWIAECDGADGPEGTCGETLGDEEEGPSCIHFGSADEVIAWMPGEGWTRRGADGALCWAGSGEREPAQVSVEVPGQMPLPGVT